MSFFKLKPLLVVGLFFMFVVAPARSQNFSSFYSFYDSSGDESPQITYVGENHLTHRELLSEWIGRRSDDSTLILLERPVGHYLDGKNMRKDYSYQELRKLRNSGYIDDVLAKRKGLVRTYDVAGEQLDEYIASVAKYDIIGDLRDRVNSGYDFVLVDIERSILDEYNISATREEINELFETVKKEYVQETKNRQKTMCNNIVDIVTEYNREAIVIIGALHIIRESQDGWKPCHKEAENRSISYIVYAEDSVGQKELSYSNPLSSSVIVDMWVENEGFTQKQIRYLHGANKYNH